MRTLTILFFTLFSGFFMVETASAGMNDGLVAYYCFEDESDLGKDCFGDNHGIATNVTQTNGWKGKGAMFGGYYQPGSIHVPNSPSLQFTDDFSIAFAVNLTGWDGMGIYGEYSLYGQHSVFAKSHDRNGMAILVRGYEGKNELTAFNFSWERPPNTLAGTSSYALGNWKHVVYVFSNSTHTAKVYIDGQLKNENADFYQSDSINSQDLFIGKYSDMWFPLNGAVDEMRIYNRALSNGEIQELYGFDLASAPLHGLNNLIMTTSPSSNFATRDYFNVLSINHSGVDLALSPDGTATASSATARKSVHAICDGTVEYTHSTGGLYSFMKVYHPNCCGRDVMVYYGHITPTPGLSAVSKDDPIGTVKNWVTATGNNSHVHLTFDTDISRDLTTINNPVCTYQLDPATNSITSLSDCGNAALTRNKIRLKVGWGQVKTLAYKDAQGHLYSTSNFYISEAAMRQLGFISFFDLYAGEPTNFSYPVEPYAPGSYNGRSFFYDANHLGEDEALADKTPVRAIGPGVIKKYGPATGYGELVVVVEHDLGESHDFTNAYGETVSTRYILSIYGHLRPSKERGGAFTGLKVGDRVSSAMIIGYVNDDAHNGDGAEHLHMGIRLSDAAAAKAKDPTGWFRGYERATHFGEDFAAASRVIPALQ